MFDDLLDVPPHVSDAQPQKPPEFVIGREYIIDSQADMIFIGTAKGFGKRRHHLFRNRLGGWIESFTDAQFLHHKIREMRVK